VLVALKAILTGVFLNRLVPLYTFSLRLQYSRNLLIQAFVNRITNYPDQLDPSGKLIDNSTKLTCLEHSDYRIEYSTVLWLIELQTGRVRRV
jgi:hypothetical protein